MFFKADTNKRPAGNSTVEDNYQNQQNYTSPAMRDRLCDRIIQAIKWISRAVKVFPVRYNSQKAPVFELINSDGFASLDFATRLLLLVLKSLQLSVS